MTKQKYLRVLIVEDDDADALLLQRKLGRFRPPEVMHTRDTTLADALERLKRTTFDVILADLGIPGSTPEEVMRRLPKACPTAAFIAVSGMTSPEVLAVAIDARIEAVLRKDGSDDHESLENQVLHAIARKRAALEEQARMRELEELVEELATELAESKTSQAAEMTALRIEVAHLKGKAEGRGEGIEMSGKTLALVLATVGSVAATIAGAIVSALME